MLMDFDRRNRGGALSFSLRANEGKIEGEIAGDKATIVGALLRYSDGVFEANETSVRIILTWINSLRRSCPLVALSIRDAVRDRSTVSGALSNSEVLIMFEW